MHRIIELQNQYKGPITLPGLHHATLDWGATPQDKK